jgi:hypothetical protein
MRYNFSACRCRTRIWFGVSGTCVFALGSHCPSGTWSRHGGNQLPFQKLLDGEHLVAGRGLIASEPVDQVRFRKFRSFLGTFLSPNERTTPERVLSESRFGAEPRSATRCSPSRSF